MTCQDVLSFSLSFIFFFLSRLRDVLPTADLHIPRNNINHLRPATVGVLATHIRRRVTLLNIRFIGSLNAASFSSLNSVEKMVSFRL